MVQAIDKKDDTFFSAGELARQLDVERQLRDISTKIHSFSMDEILAHIHHEVRSLVDSDRVTIFAADAQKKELLSKVKDGPELKEIRVPFGTSSIAGFIAAKQMKVRINDVYDDAELKKIDGALHFDSSWDKKSGYRTKQVLGVPVEREGKLFGVIQAINTKKGEPFTAEHENIVSELSKSLAIAFQNLQKMNVRASPYALLLQEGLIQQAQIDQAVAASQKEGFSVESIMASKFKVRKEDVARSLAEYYRCEFVPYSSSVTVPQDLVGQFTMDYLKHHLFVPIARENGRAVVVMANPRNLMLRDDIGRRTGSSSMVVKVSTREDILDFIDYFFGQKKDERPPEDLQDILNDIENEEATVEEGAEGDEVKEDDVGMIRLVNQMIEQANYKGASDIHVEPYIDGDIMIRYRIDGICQEYMRLPRKFRRNVVARIKIMAGLDIAERRMPQDGKIRFKNYGSLDIELRVATIPTTGGNEDAVLRILAASKPRPIAEIGMLPENLKMFQGVVEEPYGIILCVGPTGSGKTTTLHSALGHLNKPDVKIWTAEDPVEITQNGLRQVSVLPKIGFNFEKALRAFLRLDPDIIMIGEMRDLETAGAAIEASLTGHLVMSTLHTNNAPETITRLLDMGLDPYTFGDSLLAILAQRLVRTFCKECVEPVQPTGEEWTILRHEYGDDARFDALKMSPEKVKIGKLKGCEHCNKTGYKGRMGLHEILIVDDEIRQLIYRKAQSALVREEAIKKGMILLKQDGVRKIIMGKTDLAEVRSVCMR
ncbi:MAG: hypothetical protein A2Z34_03070 [Planctomycetes bacterium RBG_16_59_8]|nr:MAG: hypothetical protein A2Z34_03070 [Planctomycetes bacterium RBG_16_59_8]